MRVIWLVLAACAGPGTATPPASSPASAPAPAVAAPTTPPTHVRARVGIENGSWTDIIVHGTDENAREFCSRLVVRALIGPPEVKRVLRDCSTARLPPVRAAVQFVETDEVDWSTIAVSDLLAGRREPTPDTPVRGVTMYVLPVSDRTACEALLLQLDAEDQQRRLEMQQREATSIDAKLHEVVEKEAEACKRMDDLHVQCEKRKGDARTQCLLEAGPAHLECNSYKREHARLDAQREALAKPPTSTRSCREP